MLYGLNICFVYIKFCFFADVVAANMAAVNIYTALCYIFERYF